MPNINSILKEALSDIKPSEKELKYIKRTLAEYRKKIRKNLNKRKINADIFVGGSAAKGTLIKKDAYDLDIFIIFDKFISLVNSPFSSLIRNLPFFM